MDSNEVQQHLNTVKHYNTRRLTCLRAVNTATVTLEAAEEVLAEAQQDAAALEISYRKAAAALNALGIVVT